uniref:Uncharacterized protein n=1 Tax=Mycena chlorophos TaxID=658473 RepID=A0ABQ0L030_MYCCL|nr:predicted protein [Mycena chlorophos]
MERAPDQSASTRCKPSRRQGSLLAASNTTASVVDPVEQPASSPLAAFDADSAASNLSHPATEQPALSRAFPTQRRAELYERVRQRAQGLHVSSTPIPAVVVPISLPPVKSVVTVIPAPVYAQASTTARQELKKREAARKSRIFPVWCWDKNAEKLDNGSALDQGRPIDEVDVPNPGAPADLRFALQQNIKQRAQKVALLQDQLDPAILSSLNWMFKLVREQETTAREIDATYVNWKSFAEPLYTAWSYLQTGRNRHTMAKPWLISRVGQLALEGIGSPDPLIASYRSNVAAWGHLLDVDEKATAALWLTVLWHRRGGRGWLDDSVCALRELDMRWKSLETIIEALVL